MSTVTLPERQYLLLHDVSWEDFRRFEQMVKEQPGHRLTYDRGKLEFMTLSYLHEKIKTLLDRLIFVLVEAFDLPLASGGSTTFQRDDLARGLEADLSYYLTHEGLVRGREEIDLRSDPPPDLVAEVEVTRSVLDRLGIFAALGVPEVWRTDGEQLSFFRLDRNTEYAEQPESLYFPGIGSSDIASFLRKHNQQEERTLVQSFREWVQQQRSASST